MILVDIAVPSVDRSYDFNLDENAPITMVLEEVIGMICQKEQCKLIGDKAELLLCKYEGQIILNKEKTLKECGIKNGNRLLLV